MRLSTPLILDVEASGFGQHSYPIEVGIAFENGDRFCTLIKPHREWTHWDLQAENTHHISQQLLLENGKNIVAVSATLNELLNGKTVYTDGWVVDKPWLTTLFSFSGQEMKFRISPLEMILSEAQMDIWHSTKTLVEQDSQLVRHRASNDAFVIQETFRRTFEVENKNKIKHI
jgi:hypothetical protein